MKSPPFILHVVWEKNKDPLYLFKKAMENRQLKGGWRKEEECDLLSFWHANKAIPMPTKKEKPCGNRAYEKRNL